MIRVLVGLHGASGLWLLTTSQVLLRKLQCIGDWWWNEREINRRSVLHVISKLLSETALYPFGLYRGRLIPVAAKSSMVFLNQTIVDHLVLTFIIYRTGNRNNGSWISDLPRCFWGYFYTWTTEFNAPISKHVPSHITLLLGGCYDFLCARPRTPFTIIVALGTYLRQY